MDGCNGDIDDLEKRIKALEEGKEGADGLYDKVSTAVDDKDKYKVELLGKIKQALEGLGEDVEQEREEKERAEGDISDLKEEMDGVKPEDVTVKMVNAWEKSAQEIQDSIGEVKGDVGKSEDDLKKILEDLENLGRKLCEDRRGDAENHLRDANNKLMELIRLLKQVENDLEASNRGLASLDNGFDDQEKTNAIQENSVEALSDSHASKTAKTEEFSGEIEAIQEQIYSLDDPSTTADQWVEVSERAESLSGDIDAEFNEAKGL